MYQEPGTKNTKKPTRREQLNEWKQAQATKKPETKPKSTSVRPIRFEDMLRNDAVILPPRSTSNNPSKSKGSRLGASSTSTVVRKTASEKEDQGRVVREKVNLKLDLNIGKGVFSYTESMASSKILQDFSPSDLRIEAHHSSDGSFMIEEEEKARKSNGEFGSQEPVDHVPMSMWKSYDLDESTIREASNFLLEENKVEKKDNVGENAESDEMEIMALGEPDPKQRDLREFMKPSNQNSNQNSGNKDGIKLEVEEDKNAKKKRSTTKSPGPKSGKKSKGGDKDKLVVEKSPAKGSKKRKARDESGNKEEGILLERESLKKVLLNDSKSKEDPSKVKIDIAGSPSRKRSSGRKKVVIVKKKDEKKEEKPEQAQTGSAVEKYGSGMKYSVIEKKSKNGVERIVTPVRRSKRFSSISKSPPNSKGRSKGKSNNDSNTCSKMSVTFAEDNDVSYIHNNIGEIFEPVDDEALKIREMIKKRRPTPYSKSTKKPESDEEDEDMRDELSRALLSSGKKSSQSKGKTPGKIDVEKVLDPNVRGNGNYALLELKASSAKKIGSKKVITPLKDITNDKFTEAKEDVKFLLGENGEDIGYVPRTVEVAKKLEAFY